MRKWYCFEDLECFQVIEIPVLVLALQKDDLIIPIFGNKFALRYFDCAEVTQLSFVNENFGDIIKQARNDFLISEESSSLSQVSEILFQSQKRKTIKTIITQINYKEKNTEEIDNETLYYLVQLKEDRKYKYKNKYKRLNGVIKQLNTFSLFSLSSQQLILHNKSEKITTKTKEENEKEVKNEAKKETINTTNKVTLQSYFSYSYPLIISPSTLPSATPLSPRQQATTNQPSPNNWKKKGSHLLKAIKTSSSPSSLKSNKAPGVSNSPPSGPCESPNCYCKFKFIGKFDTSHSNSNSRSHFPKAAPTTLLSSDPKSNKKIEYTIELIQTLFATHPPNVPFFVVQIPTQPKPNYDNLNKFFKKSNTENSLPIDKLRSSDGAQSISNKNTNKNVEKLDLKSSRSSSNNDEKDKVEEWVQFEFIKILDPRDNQPLLLVIHTDISQLKSKENELKLTISRSSSTSEFLANLSHGFFFRFSFFDNYLLFGTIFCLLILIILP